MSRRQTYLDSASSADYQRLQHTISMLSMEASRKQHAAFGRSYAMESAPSHFQPGFSMDAWNAFEAQNAYQPVTPEYYEAPSYFPEAPLEALKTPFRRSPLASPSLPNGHGLEDPSCALSTTSAGSVPSASSSSVGSPYSGHIHNVTFPDSWPETHMGLGLGPAVMSGDGVFGDFGQAGMEAEMFYAGDKLSNTFVGKSSLIPWTREFIGSALPSSTRTKANSQTLDPALIQPSFKGQMATFGEEQQHFALMHSPGFHSPSAIPSPNPHQLQFSHNAHMPSGLGSPFPPSGLFVQQQSMPLERRSSISSDRSGQSLQRSVSAASEIDEEGRERGRCPHPECGRLFKDLKAHMLTHQSERPEKCPIVTCEYHFKGFARKYDKNRHTLTHYKGTMVCGFCPGSGSSAEKSFNRADVFKRHLTSVHGVEQTPPNCRKRSPAAGARKTNFTDVTAKCSTCSSTFSNAQDFYEHLDDCVLRVVQQEEPSEAINQRRLAEVADDEDVKQTMDRNSLPVKTEMIATSMDDEESSDDDEDEETAFNIRSGKSKAKVPSSRVILGSGNAISKSTRPANSARAGLTFSKGGIPVVAKGRKKKNYPPSWGIPMDKMKYKKRVLCAYDGPRRLLKDEMMLSSEYEVRVQLDDGNAYVTDLDIETLKRAEAFHAATDEERGPWMPDNLHVDGDAMLEELMA